jgi:hypothetical protein
MLLSRGDWHVFISNDKPISQGFLIASAILLAIIALPALRRKREEAFSEDGATQQEAAAASVSAEQREAAEVKADDDAGSTRKWSVYRGADGNIVAVREGFNVWAFLFVGLWALMVDLFWATAIPFAAGAVLLVIAFVWFSLSNETYAILAVVLWLPFAIFYGLRANAWLKQKYERHHYKLVRQVTAKNANIAIERGRRLATAS